MGAMRDRMLRGELYIGGDPDSAAELPASVLREIGEHDRVEIPARDNR